MISKMEKDYSKIELSLSRITKDQVKHLNFHVSQANFLFHL